MTYKLKKICFDEISSTNEYAKELARNTKENILIVANKQTAGRGRLGRTFYSPFGGIYMSVLFHPDRAVEKATDITVMASVAMVRTISSVLGIETQIKWVNDIYLNGKKVCGILTEGIFNSDNNSFDSVVLGVGLNLFTNDFPEDIKDIATSLSDKEKKGVKEALIDKFTQEFFDIFENKKEYFFEYKSRSLILGKTVEYLKDNTLHTANAVDISESGELIVIENGKKILLNSGEIKISASSLFR